MRKSKVKVNQLWQLILGFVLINFSVFMPLFSANASVLSDTAASMSPGEWKLLDAPIPKGYFITESTTSQPPASQSLAQIDTGYWDPPSKRVYFIGAGHGMIPLFAQYDEATNSWLSGSLEGFGGHTHGYDHNALDIVNRKLFRAKYNSTRSFIYDLDTQAWSENFNPTLPKYLGIINAFEYFPEVNGLLLLDYRQEKVRMLKHGSTQWETILENTGINGYQSMMEYNPVHHIMYLGGGYNDGTGAYTLKNLFVLDKDFNLKEVASSPRGFVLSYSNDKGSTNTVDPVTGNLLIFANDGNLYEYHYDKNVWSTKPANYPPIMAEGRYPALASVSIRIDTYGVIMIIKTRGESLSEAWLYKHSPSEIVPPPTQPKNLSIKKVGL